MLISRLTSLVFVEQGDTPGCFSSSKAAVRKDMRAPAVMYGWCEPVSQSVVTCVLLCQSGSAALGLVALLWRGGYRGGLLFPNIVRVLVGASEDRALGLGVGDLDPTGDYNMCNCYFEKIQVPRALRTRVSIMMYVVFFFFSFFCVFLLPTPQLILFFCGGFFVFFSFCTA